MAADYESLEARVTELEHQIRNVLPPKIDAVAFGLSVLHDDVRAVKNDVTAIRGVQDQHSAALRDLAVAQQEQGRVLEHHGRILGRHAEQLGAIRDAVAEILRRLPPPTE